VKPDLKSQDSAEKSESAEVLAKVQQVAAMAGLKVVLKPEDPMLITGFDMGQGRSQTVYIRHAGRIPTGQDVICFMSPCLNVKRGLFSGLSRRKAVDLLRRNSIMLFGFYALVPMQECDVLMVCSSQIVDTMEIEELSTHVRACAMFADGYEREHGRDEF
jgi:hypothetical protein